MDFQRARSDEQRAVRREEILDSAGAMLREMRVSDLTLNELSRRVGLAKSNVLRYFESREAVLLELMDSAMADWLAELASELDTTSDARSPRALRAGVLAGVVARSLAAQPVLCDLAGSQGGVLERNISTEVVIGHKRAALGRLTNMADLMRTQLPELGPSAERVCFHILVLVGALAPYSDPPPGVTAAYDAEPSLAALHLEARQSFEIAIRTLLMGAIAGMSE